MRTRWMDEEPPQDELRRQWHRALVEAGIAARLEPIEVGDALHELLVLEAGGVIVFTETLARARVPRTCLEDEALVRTLTDDGWVVFRVSHQTLVRPARRREVLAALREVVGLDDEPLWDRAPRHLVH